MNRKWQVRIASSLLISALAVSFWVPPATADPPLGTDLGAVEPGDVLMRGADVDGSCISTGLIAYYELPLDGPGLVLNASLDGDCRFVVQDVCKAVDCDLRLGTFGADVHSVSVDELPDPVPFACQDTYPRYKARLWTEGWPDFEWDRLTEVYRIIGFGYNCPSGYPEEQNLQQQCVWKDSALGHWKNDNCWQSGAGLPGGGYDLRLNGNFHCEGGTFCSSYDYVHTLQAGNLFYNDGSAYCSWTLPPSGELPPNWETSCTFV